MTCDLPLPTPTCLGDDNNTILGCLGSLGCRWLRRLSPVPSTLAAASVPIGHDCSIVAVRPLMGPLLPHQHLHPLNFSPRLGITPGQPPPAAAPPQPTALATLGRFQPPANGSLPPAPPLPPWTGGRSRMRCAVLDFPWKQIYRRRNGNGSPSPGGDLAKAELHHLFTPPLKKFPVK